MKKLIASSIVVLLFTTNILSVGKDPLSGILGVKQGMKEEVVRKLLRKFGK